MLARIGWYLLFLVAVAFYVLVIVYFGKKYETLTKSRIGRFIFNQVVILNSLIPIVVIPWILAGFFSRWFLLLILTAFEASLLLTYLSNYLFRIKPEESILRSRLWFAELTGNASALTKDELKKDPARITKLLRSKSLLLSMLLSLLFVVLLLLGAVALFVVATYVYFANPVHSDLAVSKILTLSLALYVITTLLQAVTTMAQISSPKIADNGRRALFLMQCVNALRIGIILTVYLGLIGIAGERFLPQSLNLPARFAQYVPMVLLSTFYLLFLIVPYFIGLESRRRAQVCLYQLILKRINTIIDVVGLPSQHDPEQLTELRNELEQETEAWIESEPIVRDLAVIVEHPEVGQLTTNAEKLVPAYQAVKDQDLRFVRLCWTDGLKAKIKEMIDEYNRFAAQPNQAEMYVMLGGSYERFFRDEQREYEEKLKHAESRKIVAPVLARLVGVLSVVPVVFQFGQKLIAILPLKR